MSSASSAESTAVTVAPAHSRMSVTTCRTGRMSLTTSTRTPSRRGPSKTRKAEVCISHPRLFSGPRVPSATCTASTTSSAPYGCPTMISTTSEAPTAASSACLFSCGQDPGPVLQGGRFLHQSEEVPVILIGAGQVVHDHVRGVHLDERHQVERPVLNVRQPGRHRLEAVVLEGRANGLDHLVTASGSGGIRFADTFLSCTGRGLAAGLGGHPKPASRGHLK